MKIVVLDGYTLNPGDLDWKDLEKLGDVTIYERTPSEKILERANKADIVLTNKTPLTDKEICALPSLQYIGVLATGYNVVDVKAAADRNVIVTNIPTYGTKSVAQMTFALLLEMTQHVQQHSDAVRLGAWSECKDFCFWKHPLIELEGKTMGIIGFGRIGQAVANVAEAYGMKILAYDAYQFELQGRNYKWADLDELLSESDVISLHCPLTQDNNGIINKNTLRKMKKSAFLINTSRGPLIVDEDLADALNKEVIAGAGLDVLSVEPPKPDNPLLTAKNCIITPHISWATKEARTRLMAIAVDNVKNFLDKTPKNVVHS